LSVPSAMTARARTYSSLHDTLTTQDPRSQPRTRGERPRRRPSSRIPPSKPKPRPKLRPKRECDDHPIHAILKATSPHKRRHPTSSLAHARPGDFKEVSPAPASRPINLNLGSDCPLDI
jgi:hypothetical protein